jgi:hypothetical protein
MQITTVHTLAFSITCDGNDQHNAALSIIKCGAQSLGLTMTERSLPMAETSPVTAPTFEICEHYWMEVMRSLAFIGVEATSP